jgi:hypothetical protein
MDKELIDSIKDISNNLKAINDTLTATIPESKPTTRTSEWNERIEPLIKEVNDICKKKWFTNRRKGQIASIAIPSIIIMIMVVGFIYSANDTVLSSSHLLALLTPDNQTVTIGNETIPQSQVNELTYKLNQIPGQLNLTIGVIAILVTIFAILVPLIFGTSTVQDLSDEFYVDLTKNKQEVDKPLIKSLVNMKCTEFHINLLQLYRTNPELFTKDTLLNRLYD